MSVTYGNNGLRCGLLIPPRISSTGNRKPGTNRLWQSLATRAESVQPKLTVSQVDDPQEREADRIADDVMRMPAADISLTHATDSPRAQRKSAGDQNEESSRSSSSA